MPRKPTPPAAAPAVILNEQALAQAGAAATELVLLDEQHEASVRALAESLGYELPADAVDPDLIQRDIVANMRRSVEACLEVGKALNVLKAACSHGEFVQRLESIGLEPRVGQRFMLSATKFAAKAATSPLLKAAGTQSKLFELLVLDDDQVEELEQTGKSGELALDEIACMGVRELRAALRESREAGVAKDGVIASQNDKISAQAERLQRKFKPSPSSLAKSADEEAALQELTQATNGAEVTFMALANVSAELATSDRLAVRERAQQALQYLVARMRAIVLETGLEVLVDDEALTGRPAWLDGGQ